MFVRCKSCGKVYMGSMTDMLEEGWGIITHCSDTCVKESL